MENTDLHEVTIKGVTLKFKTKPGVFAKHGLDDGTKLLLENLDIKESINIADLGSGAGVVGFFVAKSKPSAKVDLLDDHLRSVELAKENARLNDIDNIEVHLSDLFSALPDTTYDLIITNPPQQLGNQFLAELTERSLQHLKPGGRLVLVIKNNLKNVFKRLLNNPQVVARGREHLVLEMVKPT